jgi:S-DNA-T family DNA segregation ATPase FtsK/SpoIIIE
MNTNKSIVSFEEIVGSEALKNARMEIPVILGKDNTGVVQVVELTKMPHLLIAGDAESGKSVFLNSIILSILYKQSFNEVKLILIDLKNIDLKPYNGIPQLLAPVITEPKRAFQALQYCIVEMERRYSLLDAMGVRDIRSYNSKLLEKSNAKNKLPYIVVIMDEYADLMATIGKELESTLARLAAMSRAVGIHLLLATQRPSIDVITGLLQVNIPSRIAFKVASTFHSDLVIGMEGAEKLLGNGDMLYVSAINSCPVRIQGAYVSEDEVDRAVAHAKTLGEPDYIDEELFVDDEDDDGPSLFDEEDDDPLYERALEIVVSQGKASASFLQRKLDISYNRAARIVEMMEEKGIVGPAQGSKPRNLIS